MGLRDNAAQLSHAREQARAVRRCKAVSISEALPVEDREFYLAQVLPDTGGYTAVDVSQLLAKEGVSVSTSTIVNHRGQRCGCPA